MTSMDYKIVGFALGFLLTLLGLAELIPAIFELTGDLGESRNFLTNACFCLFFGISLVLANKSFEREVNIRHAFMLTTLSWVFLSAFAALPLYMSPNLDISYTDAFFESISGITTTGSTVLSGLDDMPAGILLWRSMIQWIGGIGLVAFAIILLPALRVGGMQLFQTESSDTSEKFLPRSATVMKHLLMVYIGITALCAVCYYIGGMSAFDAINHAMTTICTGGYSTHDASFGYFKSIPLQLCGAFFMFLGGLPFILYVKLIYQSRFDFFKDEQVIIYSAIVAILAIILTWWIWQNHTFSLSWSFTYAIFNIISVITTTGYATLDYTALGAFSITFFFFLTYVGSCAGSTAGGIKIMRLSIASKAMKQQIDKMLYPSGVFPLRYQGRVIDNVLADTVLGFLGLYALSNMLLAFALTALGLDFETAISGAATAIANVGPGIGNTIGPAGNFATLPDTAKWLLCVGMLIGRLEILTVIVIFTPAYWH
ncbi:MAG: TrkH family potassium uptake protein [Alphaproteobacteria bacterium]